MGLRVIGGMWIKVDKNGNKYMSGTISENIDQGTYIKIFRNVRKKEPKHPDFNITIQTDDDYHRR